MTLDLTGDETAALVQLLRRTIDENRYPLSPRLEPLSKVAFHALCHTQASALIAARVDVLTISRRLGHANPSITLNVYGHLIDRQEDKATAALDAALGS